MGTPRAVGIAVTRADAVERCSALRCSASPGIVSGPTPTGPDVALEERGKRDPPDPSKHTHIAPTDAVSGSECLRARPPAGVDSPRTLPVPHTGQSLSRHNAFSTLSFSASLRPPSQSIARNALISDQIQGLKALIPGP